MHKILPKLNDFDYLFFKGLFSEQFFKDFKINVSKHLGCLEVEVS